MNSYDYSGKVAVITGGANGIGAAVAQRMVQSGAKVAIWDMDIRTPEAKVADLPAESRLFVQVDVSSQASVAAAMAATEAAFGKVDILVNSAGIAGPNATLANYDPDIWRRILAINLDGSFLCCKAVVPGMMARNYGRIVNIASVAGKDGNPNASAYSASKAAVIGLTKSLGKELADTGVRVNCVTPAAVKTAIFDQMTPEHIQFMLSKIPMARFGEPEEVAAMVTWLSTEECSFSTGAVFDLSGGRSTY